MIITIIFLLIWTLLLIIEIRYLKQQKALKKNLELVLGKMQHGVDLYHRKSQLAGFTLKKAHLLSEDLKKEQLKIKETNQFMNKAVKEKVNKKKIRGKRRRKTA
ncbi:hypothetical protein [Peribacillus aracenensis]|uniref:hypothetical protein n=1 Tax=Peribacillus aracenensis TaxID=2976708 RepID=UPI0021A5531F|nr:hypothetical protein [Peribacillus sp. BBB004]